MGDPNDKDRGIGDGKRGTENAHDEIIAGRSGKINTVAHQSGGKLHRPVVSGDMPSNDTATVEKEASPRYKPGEIKQSRSEAGFYDVDVREVSIAGGKGLVIMDFGVGQGDIKSSTKEEPLLNQWLKRFARNSTYRLVVEGSTDNVGSAVRNSRLKQSRAEAFLELLDSSTRSRTIIVTTEPHAYVNNATVNNTPKQRALNRSVVIMVESSAEFEGDSVKGARRSPNQIIEHARLVYQRSGRRTDEDWGMYGSLTMLLNPNTDDRYIDGKLWEYKGANTAIKSIKRLRTKILQAVDPNASDSKNMKEIDRLARQIEGGISYGLTANRLAAGGGSSLARCHRNLIYSINNQLSNPDSIYYPWKNTTVKPSYWVLTPEVGCDEHGKARP